METYTQEIQNWADNDLDIGEIDGKKHKYVTDIQDTHHANTKPLYKTHT